MGEIGEVDCHSVRLQLGTDWEQLCTLNGSSSTYCRKMFHMQRASLVFPRAARSGKLDPWVRPSYENYAREIGRHLLIANKTSGQHLRRPLTTFMSPSEPHCLGWTGKKAENPPRCSSKRWKAKEIQELLRKVSSRLTAGGVPASPRRNRPLVLMASTRGSFNQQSDALNGSGWVLLSAIICQKECQKECQI